MCSPSNTAASFFRSDNHAPVRQKAGVFRRLAPARRPSPQARPRRALAVLRRVVESVVVAGALGGGIASCGAGTEPRGPVVFDGPPLLMLPAGDSGWVTAWRFSPAVPRRGFNAAEIGVYASDGTPLAGLHLAVVPWMPAHAHGASVKAEVEETAPGTYVVQPLYLYMGGRWELRTSLARETEAEAATLAPAFDIP